LRFVDDSPLVEDGLELSVPPFRESVVLLAEEKGGGQL
jgi:hypothetical protein